MLWGWCFIFAYFNGPQKPVTAALVGIFSRPNVSSLATPKFMYEFMNHMNSYVPIHGLSQLKILSYGSNKGCSFWFCFLGLFCDVHRKTEDHEDRLWSSAFQISLDSKCSWWAFGGPLAHIIAKAIPYEFICMNSYIWIHIYELIYIWIRCMTQTYSYT